MSNQIPKQVPFVLKACAVFFALLFSAFFIVEISKDIEFETNEEKLEPFFQSSLMPEWFPELANEIIAIDNSAVRGGDRLLVLARDLRKTYESSPELFALPNQWLIKVANNKEIPDHKVQQLITLSKEKGYLDTFAATNWLVELAKEEKYEVDQTDGLAALEHRLAKESSVSSASAHDAPAHENNTPMPGTH